VKICIDCKREFSRKALNRRGRCQECAMKAWRDAAEQMHQRDGPYYERWLEGKHKAVENYKKSMEKAVSKYAAALDYLEYDATPEGQAEMLLRIGVLKRALGDD